MLKRILKFLNILKLLLHPADDPAGPDGLV